MGDRCQHVIRKMNDKYAKSCYDVTDNERQEIFFDWQQREVYVAALVEVVEKKESTQKTPSRAGQQSDNSAADFLDASENVKSLLSGGHAQRIS